MKKTIAVIGMGRFGLSLVESFSKTNVEILAIDSNKERVEKAAVYTPYLLSFDSTNEDALKESGIKSVDQVILAMGQNEEYNISTTIITVIKLKKLGIKKITVRVDDDIYNETISLVGADQIIHPLKIASEKLANKLSSESVIDYFKMTDDFYAYEINVPEHFSKMNISDLDIRSKYSVNILVITRDNMSIIPNKDTDIKPGDHLFVFGKKKDINKIVGYFDTNK